MRIIIASFNIHLAVAKKYCEKNNIKDVENFYEGSIKPDLVENKKITHYTGYCDKSNLKRYLLEKVRLDKFLENENIDSDFQKGIFLHLVTDFLFFNDFFEKEYIEKNNYDSFIKDLYYSYRITNYILIEKYSISKLKSIEEIMNKNIKEKLKNVNDQFGNNILPMNKLELFIENVSSINLEEYKNKNLSKQI